MSRTALIFALVILVHLASGIRHPASAEEVRPNVLLIAIDDLNDWVGCLSDPELVKGGGHPDARTPHIDRLAKRGVLFTNAHCQAPICNPSRTSVMYGLRPSTTGVYMNSPKPWTVPAMKDRVTMPRHFAANGYLTLTTGKIYHGSGLPPGDFDVVGPRPGQRIKEDARLIPPTPDGAKGLWDFGAQAYDEKLMQDHADATWAITFLESGLTEIETGPPRDSATLVESRPFFLAIGFYRPHVPFYSPTRVYIQVPRSEIELPPVKADDWSDIPKIAKELTTAPAAPKHSWFVDNDQWLPAVQAYHACVRWTDEQVGRLLDALDASPHADNTIVVLYSDHGFFLGEKQRWAKQSLWERATKVPFIMVGPGVSAGTPCKHPAELLGIYPTLIELCGLPKRDDLDGRSLVPLLKDPAAAWEHPAITTHGKDNHAVRGPRYRYIRYRDASEELYDLEDDPNEWTNLLAPRSLGEGGADEPKFASVKSRLARHLPATNADPAKAVPGKKRPRKTRK